MLDIKLIRGNPDYVRKNLERRRNPAYTKTLDAVLLEDLEWRRLLQHTEGLRQRRNEISREINAAKKAGKPAEKLLSEARKIPLQIRENEKKQETLRASVHSGLMKIPNLLHESVPYGKDETGNVEVKAWGKKPEFRFSPEHHGRLAAALNGADFERAVKISGSGFFFLQNGLALMDLALQRFAIDLLLKKGYILTLPPAIMRRAPYEGTVDLDDFEKVMYKIEGEDTYLIATAEHPLAAMRMNEMLDEAELPIRLAGLSPCFRREIGKHGLDERGLFRVHQFSKVEQFIFCEPEESWNHFEELARNSEGLLEALGIPYRRVNICTGDLGLIANKKYDIEGWSPREQKYIELMSCSNCTDYQSNRLGIRYRKRSGEKAVPHTLNNTMVATARALRIILENFQTASGALKVPRPLQPYMNGMKEIKPSAPKQRK